MLRIFRAPVFPSLAATQRARIFHEVTLATMAVAGTRLLLIIVVAPSLIPRPVAALPGVNAIGFCLLPLNRRGHTRLASIVLVSCLIGLVTTLSLTAGGIRSPGVTAYLIFVLMAGLLLGPRLGMVAAAVC